MTDVLSSNAFLRKATLAAGVCYTDKMFGFHETRPDCNQIRHDSSSSACCKGIIGADDLHPVRNQHSPIFPMTQRWVLKPLFVETK